MGIKSNGFVGNYVHATLDVYFPHGEVTCHNCELMYHDKAGRPRCGHTNAMLFWAREDIHEYCPLKFDKEEDK